MSRYDDIIARMKALGDELKPLLEKPEMTDAEVTRFNEIHDEVETLDGEKADIERFEARKSASLERIRKLAPVASREDGPIEFDSDPLDGADVKRTRNPWDRNELARIRSVEDLVSRALDAVAATPGPSDKRREVMTRMIEHSEDGDRIARLALATTSPEYKSAYGKIARSGGVQWADLTDVERQAIQYADEVRRAMSIGTDAGGGYLVPLDIEAAVTLSTAGTNNPIYSRARRVQTTSDSYRVVTSPNAAWSWDGENTEVSDDTPTFANTDIPLYLAQGFVPYSYASAGSISGITGIISDVLMGGWNDLVGAALTTGTGSSQPTGIVTALTGGAVTSASTDTFAIADVFSTFEPLPARHRRNAVWMSSIEALGDIRAFGSSDSYALLNRLGDGEDGLRLLGRPWIENEDMDSTVTALANNYYLLIGDFQHYVVAEGVGTVTRFIPDVFGTTGRPIGASGVYMAAHFGADSVLDDAFRLLNVT